MWGLAGNSTPIGKAIFFLGGALAIWGLYSLVG